MVFPCFTKSCYDLSDQGRVIGWSTTKFVKSTLLPLLLLFEQPNLDLRTRAREKPKLRHTNFSAPFIPPWSLHVETITKNPEFK